MICERRTQRSRKVSHQPHSRFQSKISKRLWIHLNDSVYNCKKYCSLAWPRR